MRQLCRFVLAACAVALLASSSFAADAPPGALPQKVLDAAKAALDGWELEYADRAPKVDAGDGFKGYRVVFSKRYDEDLEKGVSGTTKPRFNHFDLVLLPKAKGLDPVEARGCVVWSQMPEEYFSSPRWIGSGLGYEWLCRANLMQMDEFRSKMKLSGGEPRKAALAAGLSSEDRGFASAKYAVDQLRSFGKDAIIDIVPQVSAMSSAGKIPYAPMNALKFLACPEADAALASFFASPDKNVSLAAGSALCAPPFVEKAKTAYLDMLKERRFIPQCADACRLFGLGAEAAQQLQSISASPKSLLEFSDSMTAMTAVKNGKPDLGAMELAQKIAETAAHSGEVPGTPQTFVLGETPESNKAKLIEMDMKRLRPLENQLSAYQNQDMAFVAALWLCLFNAPEVKPEYIARVRESGGRVMRALPRQTAEAYLSRLGRKLESKQEAEAVQKIYRRTASLAGDLPSSSSGASTTPQPASQEAPKKVKRQ